MAAHYRGLAVKRFDTLMLGLSVQTPAIKYIFFLSMFSTQKKRQNAESNQIILIIYTEIYLFTFLRSLGLSHFSFLLSLWECWSTISL